MKQMQINKQMKSTMKLKLNTMKQDITLLTVLLLAYFTSRYRSVRCDQI